MMSSLPVFQKFRLSNGGVLLVKISAVAEISEDELPSWQDSYKRFRSNLTGYRIRDDGNTRVIAGLIQSFGAKQFHHSNVVKWGAFAEVDLSERDVSNALKSLKTEEGSPVEPIGQGGPGATWKINQEALGRYLK